DGTDHPRQRGTIDLLGVLVHLDDLLDAALLRGAVGVQLLLLLRALLGLGLGGASVVGSGPLGAGVSSRRAAGCGRRRSRLPDGRAGSNRGGGGSPGSRGRASASPAPRASRRGRRSGPSARP